MISLSLVPSPRRERFFGSICGCWSSCWLWGCCLPGSSSFAGGSLLIKPDTRRRLFEPPALAKEKRVTAFWKKYRKKEGSVGRQLAIMPEVTSAVLNGMEWLVNIIVPKGSTEIHLRPQKLRKPVVGFISCVAVLNTYNKPHHTGDTSTGSRVNNNKPQRDLSGKHKLTMTPPQK